MRLIFCINQWVIFVGGERGKFGVHLAQQEIRLLTVRYPLPSEAFLFKGDIIVRLEYGKEEESLIQGSNLWEQ